MLANLKPYPEMKDSGVEWLGKVPVYWDVGRLRNIAEIRFSNVDKHSKDDEHAIRLCNYSDVYYNERIRSDIEFMRATATAEEIERFRLVAGDVLITKDSESWKDIGVPALIENTDHALVCGYHLALLRPNMERVSGEFLHRALSCRPVANQFFVRASGVTRFGLSQTAIRSVWLPVAPPSEQAAIVRFLDHVDRRIQRYIRAKEKLIALLEEQKQAIIHEAVTGRIDVRTGKSYPTYKPSGVEWLGDIPEHWHTKKLRQCVNLVGGMTPSMEDPRFWGGDVPWVTPKDMKQDAIDESSVKVSKAALDETSLRLIDPPAVLMVVRGMILARKIPIAWITNSVTINQDMKALIPNPGFEAEFLARALMAAQGALASGIDVAGHGTRRLPTERWRALEIPIAPSTEQQTIMTFVSSTIREIEEAVGNIRSLIDGLGEFVTRLIADVVTGKVDVREAAAALPEEAGLSGNDLAEVEDDAGIQTEALEMTDWDTCPAVERKPGKVSGAWVFAGTRIPLSALYENLAGGATIDEFVEWFPGVDEQQVRAVLEHEAKALRTAASP